MNNFWQRALTGTLFVITLVGCTVLNEWSFFILLFVINFLCLLEFFELMLPDKNWIEKYLGVIAGSVINIMFVFIIRGDLSPWVVLSFNTSIHDPFYYQIIRKYGP